MNIFLSAIYQKPDASKYYVYKLWILDEALSLDELVQDVSLLYNIHLLFVIGRMCQYKHVHWKCDLKEPRCRCVLNYSACIASSSSHFHKTLEIVMWSCGYIYNMITIKKVDLKSW